MNIELETGRFTITFGLDEDGDPATTFEKSDGVNEEMLLGALIVASDRYRERAAASFVEREPEEDDDAGDPS